jgi:hypothetical protein
MKITIFDIFASLIIFCLLVIMPLGLGGCVTSTSPDGTVTQQMDLVSVQAALDMAMQIYALYQERNPGDTESDTAVSMQDKIDYWTQILAGLRELQGATKSVDPVTVTIPNGN